MNKIKIFRIITLVAFEIVGITIMLSVVNENVTHLDDGNVSPLTRIMPYIAYAIMILSPLILRFFKIAGSILLLIFTFEIWLWLS